MEGDSPAYEVGLPHFYVGTSCRGRLKSVVGGLLTHHNGHPPEFRILTDTSPGSNLLWVVS
jgi:hypothetical protein